MAVQEGLGGLGGVGLYEAAVAVGQVDDEAVGLPLHPADDHPGLAEVALSMARGWDRGTNISRIRRRRSRDVVLDDGVLALKPVLVAKALEDALGGVALLPGNAEVALKDPRR